MIKQIKIKPKFRKEVKCYIRSLAPYKGGEWSSINTNLMKEFKSTLKKQLLQYQENECAYCGLKLGETGKTEIEHIAPKGGKNDPKYVQYMFTTCNLVLACNLCNSPLKKGTKNTINNFDENNKNYRKNDFNIYHPYFDNPNDHFEFGYGIDQIIIRGKSDKGQHSIEMFDLDSEAQCTARAKKSLYEGMIINPEIEDYLKSVMEYKKW